MNIKNYIELNRELRSGAIKRRSGATQQSNSVAITASSDVGLSSQLTRAIFDAKQFATVAETLYTVPEIGLCVDFWKANIGSSRLMVSADDPKDEKFADALEKYLNTIPMMNGLPFKALFNQNGMDYVLQGNEVYLVSSKKIEVDGFYFPAAILPVKFKDVDISSEEDEFGYFTYSVSTKGKEFKDKQIFLCKRSASPADEFGTSVLFRALRPIQKQLSDNELDRSVTKMGIASSFVLIKYGTDESPRQDSELQELYDEISTNLEAGIGFGVVPPDIAAESLFKSSALGQFNRDKIYEMYIASINYAFGGVLSAVSPQSNTGASSDRPLIILKNILQSERENRKEQIIDRVSNYCALMNNKVAPNISMGSIKIIVQTENDISLKEFDRGIVSHETYLEDRYEQEVSRLRREHKDNADVVVPRDLPYTKSQDSGS